MLSLKRKVDQKVIIVTSNGERIEVVVIRTERDIAHLGIIAPEGVNIFRAELENK